MTAQVGFCRCSRVSGLPQKDSSQTTRSKLCVLPQGISPKLEQKQSMVLLGKSVTSGVVMTSVQKQRERQDKSAMILSIGLLIMTNIIYHVWIAFGFLRYRSLIPPQLAFHLLDFPFLPFHSILRSFILCPAFTRQITLRPIIFEQMQQKQQKQAIQQQSLRYQLLPLFQTNVQTTFIPLHAIEIIFQFIPYLQTLKFSIDYFTMEWLGNTQPIFSFLDASYYLNFASAATYQLAFIISIAYMNLYWITILSFFLTGRKYSTLGLNLKKFVFIVNRNLLILPFFNLILNMYNCNATIILRRCLAKYNVPLQAIAIVSFAIFALLTLAQTFFNFDFIAHKKEFRRIKKSSFLPVGIIVFLLLNEALSYFLADVTQLIILDISSVLLLVILWVKDEQVTEKMKLIELSFLGTNLLALLMVNIVYFTNQDLSLLLFFFLSSFLIAGIMQIKTYSLKFELQNINKWTTSEIMIRYAGTLRYYLSRKEEYIFKVYIHGYMEMHRQKCDNPTCASRCDFTETEKKLFQSGKLKKQDEQVLRIENIVKKIYCDGYKLTPISAELQLEYAIFLYEIGEKELALKNLLLIKYQELSYDKYYKYSFMKEKIHREMCEEPNKNFLDLVSELRVKREEDLILKKFQKAALINLEFWSILNEDHPDFQKLNEVGATRIQIRKEVKQSYRNICSIAHSQKITSLYVHYLEAIQNDEDMYNEIYQAVKEDYDLDKKIVLQDWANSSSAIMLVSIDETNHGVIIDTNSSCASLFGYERYEILNRPLKLLFTEELKEGIKDFLCPSNQEETFYMTHKSGYLVKMKRRSQNYNSMETGMASIITLSIQVTPNNCFFVLDRNEKIFGVSSSIISLIGLEMKAFEGEVFAKDFFSIPLKTATLEEGKEDRTYKLQEILKQQYDSQTLDYSARQFKVSHEQKAYFSLITLEYITLNKLQSKNKRKNSMIPVNFQFQIQATLTTFKYFGNFSEHETYLSQFSQIQYAESLKQANSAHSYATGITTLRLKDNIIQVIEQIDEEQVEKMLVKNSEITRLSENIARKDQELIFENKTAYEEFINRFTFAKSVNFILLVSMVGLIAIYITYYFLFSTHYQAIQTLTSEIAYQNLIIGAVAKQLSLLYGLQLVSAGASPETAARFTNIYADNLNYLETIKLQGSEPYQVPVLMGSVNQTFLTDQFLLSFVNYAISVYGNMSQAKNQSDLVRNYKAAPATTIQYLIQNSKQLKEIMVANADAREQSIAAEIGGYMKMEIVMFVGGIVFVILFAVIMLIVIHKINKERIKIFEIFLDISEIQIQQFSSKTEKFLLSLHVEDTNGEIDVDQEVENTKKINNSTFAKKKRFKLINFNKSIYVKLLLIPIFATAYFVHSFVQSYISLAFQNQSYQYFTLTSRGDYTFFSGLSAIQAALLDKTAIPNSLSETYISYYRDYFDMHFTTFGYVDDFHQAFTSIFMLDTCKGMSSAYGSTKIPASCEIPLLSSNGSYLVFTEMAMNTEFFSGNSSLTYNYLVDYQVLSKTHRMLTEDLIIAQSNFINTTLSNLLTTLLIWALIMSIVSFIYGVPIMKRFIDEINEIKNILSILPISVARELPLAPSYFNKILEANEAC